MKIFISWSGKISLQVAEILKKWLPKVLQSVEPFVSTDIGKGKRWSDEIAQELSSTEFGIICVTKDNLSAPWLNFEAEALSKTVDSRVQTLLFGLKTSDISSSPLNQFQVTKYEREEIKKLISEINKGTAKPLSKDILDDAFNARWQELFEQLESVYQLTKRKVIWAYEESNVSSETEINAIRTKFSVTNINWYLDEDEKPKENDCDILIYVYGKSSESKSKLEKIINFAESINKNVALHNWSMIYAMILCYLILKSLKLMATAPSGQRVRAMLVEHPTAKLARASRLQYFSVKLKIV